jgi:hypothetical protein
VQSTGVEDSTSREHEGSESDGNAIGIGPQAEDYDDGTGTDLSAFADNRRRRRIERARKRNRGQKVEFKSSPPPSEPGPSHPSSESDDSDADPEMSHQRHQAMEDRRKTPSIDSPPTQNCNNHEKSKTSLEAALDAAKTDLFITLTRKSDRGAPKTATLNLATAQRLVLSNIQRKLVARAYKLWTISDNGQVEDELLALETELADYCEMIRHLKSILIS